MQPETSDVIIIGAGMAGLAAASRLARLGYAVRILEARNRIGGRIWTQHCPTSASPIELGAEFIHGLPRETWDLVASSYNLAYALPASESQDPWKTVDRVFKYLRSPGSSPDRPFSHFLDSLTREQATGEEKRMISSFVEGFHAADTDRVSEHSLAIARDEQDRIQDDRVYRPVGGYDSLLSALLQTINNGTRLHLGKIVTDVQWKERDVSVLCRPGGGLGFTVFKARAALLTVPLGVWKAPTGSTGTIAFEPRLHDKQRAIQGLEMGPVIKIIFQFRHAFWEKTLGTDVSFMHSYGAEFPTWWTAYPMRVPHLTGWAGAATALSLSTISKTELLRRAMDSLSGVLALSRRELEQELQAYYFHDWQHDPFTRGAYSYVLTGGLASQRALAVPVDDTLFFAGEATHTNGRTGTVDGAMESGYRAAGEIADALRQTGRRAA